METAAVERVRNSVGSAQNGDLNAYRPARLKLIRATATYGSLTIPAPTSDIAATANGSAEWRRRSFRRSELRDHRTMTTVANKYGAMAIRPTWVCVSDDEKPAIICG